VAARRELGDVSERESVGHGTTNISPPKTARGQALSIPRPDSNKIADLFNQHPELFKQHRDRRCVLQCLHRQRRNLTQTVWRGYGMADMRFGAKLNVRTGVRWEKTENETRDFQPLPPSEGRVPRDIPSTRRPSDHDSRLPVHVFTNPLFANVKTYDNFFPMIAVKYSFTRDLQFHAGFNKAISRPPADSLCGRVDHQRGRRR
jgi:outer membrane receptor protein involved in Fe transport